MKRSENSLFTIDELKTWCQKHGFYYIEDSEIWLYGENGEYQSKHITKNNKNFWVYRRFPFLHKNDISEWYKCLMCGVLNFKTQYSDVFIYDIIDTTLDWQRKKGEFYSMWVMSCLRHTDDSMENQIERLKKIEGVFDIKENNWKKPKFDECGDFVVGFENIKS